MTFDSWLDRFFTYHFETWLISPWVFEMLRNRNQMRDQVCNQRVLFHAGMVDFD
jgi:hypothetical protein